jgi:hypothetical protein
MADEQAFEWSCGWSYVGFCGSDKLGQKDEIFDQSQRQTKPSTTNMAHR